LWFTEANANQIGKISPLTGQITEYNIPTNDSYPVRITAGPDGDFGSLSKMGIKLVKYLPRPVRLQNTVYPLPALVLLILLPVWMATFGSLKRM